MDPSLFYSPSLLLSYWSAVYTVHDAWPERSTNQSGKVLLIPQSSTLKWHRFAISHVETFHRNLEQSIIHSCLLICFNTFPFFFLLLIFLFLLMSKSFEARHADSYLYTCCCMQLVSTDPIQWLSCISCVIFFWQTESESFGFVGWLCGVRLGVVWWRDQSPFFKLEMFLDSQDSF